jgi:hypothetical protein
MIGVKEDLSAKIDVELDAWYVLRDDILPAFNALIRNSEIDFIGVPED